jgi:hypothetical protein
LREKVVLEVVKEKLLASLDELVAPQLPMLPQEVLSSLVRHGTASGSYLIAYSLLQHENHHLVKTFFSLNRKGTNQ